MDHPVDFLDRPRWRDGDGAAAALEVLERLGFRVTPECCEVKALERQALGLLHEDGKHFAVVYEDRSDGVWLEVGIRTGRCKLDADTWGSKYLIATGAPTEMRRRAPKTASDRSTSSC